MLDVCLEHFPHAQQVLDLGGGHGEHSLELARRGLRATMQDRPEVIEAAGRDEVTASFGLQMLVWTDGGDAHSVADYHRWLTEAGYGSMQTHDLDHPPQTIVLARC